jgi:rhodanese-related sulfurtransferase
MRRFGNQPKLAIWHLLSESAKEVFMADAPRITVADLKRRMDAGQDFTIVDVRNPTAWAESDTAIPEAIRVPLEELEPNLPRIPKNRPVVAYCT